MYKEVDWKVKGIYKASAPKIYEEIISIGDSYTPQQIVDRARDESTELHKCFEWDDTVAAEKFRCEQARSIIKMLVVHQPEKEDGDGVPIVTRVIVSTNEHNNHYTPIQVVVRNEDAYQKLLRTALEELEAFRKKYRNLSELESVIDSIEELLRGD